VSNLVSTTWLNGHFSASDICILDCSWHLPTTKRDAKVEFVAAHIPGAQFFDIDANSDREIKLPHMLPSAAQFSATVSGLGIGNTTKVICYDSLGLFSAARVWWMFKTFGHENVSVLDGGLKKWLAEQRGVESGPAALPAPKNFTAKLNPKMVIDMEGTAASSAQILDARSPTRFRGEEPEPRPGVKPGHMPGAINTHYASLLQEDGTLKSPAALTAMFEAAKVKRDQPIITSCGSGVTAAIITLALTELGATNLKLYDGSWAEWGASNQRVVTGA
jgi:thiosulfate/3-mercaptopyruvate sulfurtransferase